jgi:hypothetical protein
MPWELSNELAGAANTLVVDAEFGSDITGTRGNEGRPFATITKALTVALAGDVVFLRPGTYPESGLVVPPEVSLVGDSWKAVIVGDAGATQDIITLTSGLVQGITLACPSAAGFAALRHTSGTGGLYSCNIAGDNGAGASLGDGVVKTGTGKLIGGNIRCEQGGLNAAFRVDSGVLALDDVHGPLTTASVAVFLLTEGTGRYQGQGFNCGNPQCADAVRLEGTSTCLLYSPNIFNVGSAVHIAADGVEFTCTGGKIGGNALTVEVDLALTGTGTRVECLATVLEPLFSFPPAAAGNTDFVLSFTQLRTDIRPARRREIGQDLALGFPEVGSGLYVGKGASYGDGILCVSSDSTGTGNLTDETAAAQSLIGSTFTWQGTTAGHCLYFASARFDPAGTPLRHWGALVNQTTAGVGGEYVFELWDGAAWSEVGVMAVGAESGYRYGDDVFIRTGTEEDLRYGIDNNTTWATTTLGAFGSRYWLRVRIAVAPGTLPSFERWWLTESTLHVNKRGQITATGTAQFFQTVVNAGNIFASGGSTTNGIAAVGSAPVSWNHDLDRSRLNQTNDTISTQFILPAGINTAFPVKFRVSFDYSIYNNPPTLEGYCVGVERQGVLVADPAGGDVPIERSAANTAAFNSQAGDLTSVVPTGTGTGKVFSAEFGPCDISGLYAGDLVLFHLVLANDGGGGGSATDVQVWGIEVKATAFATGELV